MSFLDHLEELRWHIIRSLGVLVLLGIVAFVFKRIIFDVILLGPSQDDFITYQGLCSLSERFLGGDLFCFERAEFSIINTELTAEFLLHLKAAFSFGLVAAFPYVIYEIWRFVSPGLYENEARATQNVVLVSSLLFYVGVAFGYFILFPLSFQFFANYSISDVIVKSFTIKSYLGFMIMLLIASGVMFELPMVVFILSRLGLLTPGLMRDYRRHALVVIFILSALITPADPGTMMMVALPLAGLYEISIFISARVVRAMNKRDASE